MKNKSLEVVVSTVENDGYSLYKNMNITSDLVVINQTNYTSEKIIQDKSKVRIYNYNERGVGKSRNKGLMNCNADICLIADDDMKYVENYEQIVIQAFQELPDADIIIFDIVLQNINKEITRLRPIKKIKKVHSFNSMRYGACRMAIKSSSQKKKNVWFSLLLGGGAMYSSGEDSLFLRECFKKKMTVYTYPKVIAYVDESNSSWYTGVNDKYLKDRGAFLALAFPKICYLLAIYYSIRISKLPSVNKGIRELYYLMKTGIKEIKDK